MIRRTKNIVCGIFNNPQRLTILVRDVKGSCVGKEIVLSTSDNTIRIPLAENDEFTNDIKTLLKKIIEVI